MRTVSVSLAVLALGALSGCGSDSDPFAAPPPSQPASGSSFEAPDNVRTWANSVSALALYLHLYQPIAVADGADTLADPACPVIADDGTTLSMTGGCTDATGTTWIGTASVKRAADGERSVKFDGFGTQTRGKPDTTQGEGNVRRIDDDNHDFSLDLVHEASVRATVAYEGHVTGGYGSRTVWSGSGTVTREGLVEPTGTVDVTTTAQVVDDAVCSGQPSSGNTTLHNADDETVVVTYDGDVDCDPDHAANFSYNGVPKGKITGIVCAATPGRGGSRTSTWVVVALACALGLRRRRG